MLANLYTNHNKDAYNQAEIKELWLQLLKGNKSALENIFKIFYPALYDFGYRLCRNEEKVYDAIQDVFVYIWSKRISIKPVDSIKAYLITCLRNKLITNLKEKQKDILNKKNFAEEALYFSLSPEEIFISNEHNEITQHVLQDNIYKLPVRKREALYYKTYHNLTYREIGNIMNISEQVARNYVCEALNKLRSLISVKEL